MQIRKKKRIREGMVEHLTIGNHIANCIIHFCLIMVAVISLLPMWHVLMSSVSDGFSLLSYKGVAVVPIGKPTLEGYRRFSGTLPCGLATRTPSSMSPERWGLALS